MTSHGAYIIVGNLGAAGLAALAGAGLDPPNTLVGALTVIVLGVIGWLLRDAHVESRRRTDRMEKILHKHDRCLIELKLMNQMQTRQLCKLTGEPVPVIQVPDRDPDSDD